MAMIMEEELDEDVMSMSLNGKEDAIETIAASYGKRTAARS